jgi:hypothetical protein
MKLRHRFARFESNPAARTLMFLLGVIIVLISPLVGAIPGPGGVFVFAAGFGLMLRYSLWTKKLYARAKRRWPHHGRWTDWGLRRESAKRRATRDGWKPGIRKSRNN